MNTSIDDTIQNLERLYTSITGQTAPAGDQPYAPIPPELDARSYVEDQMARLLSLVESQPIGAVGAASQPAQAWAPPVSIREAGEDLVVELDLAGVARDHVSVTASSELLTVTGRREASGNGTAGERVRFSERPFGTFRRTIPLPAGATPEQMTAQMKDGVLEVRMPHAADPAREPRTIPIT